MKKVWVFTFDEHLPQINGKMLVLKDGCDFEIELVKIFQARPTVWHYDNCGYVDCGTKGHTNFTFTYAYMKP